MHSNRIKSLLEDIRFWIIFFCLLRLYGITNPPLEVAHNWRQTTVTMVARNFYENDANIFYPRVDFAGNKSGVTGMEFPLLNYLIYAVSLLFGYAHWYGRIINLIVSGLGCYFFYRLVMKYFGYKTAFNSTILLLCSIWFAYSRKIMPDTFSVSLTLAGVYCGIRFFEGGRKWTSLVGYVVLCSAGILSKLPAVCVLVVGLPLFFSTKYEISAKIIFAIAGLLLLIPVGFWYGYWVSYLVEQYGFQHFFMGKNAITGFREIIAELPLTLSQFYENAMKFSGFAVFILGVYFAIAKHNKLLTTLLLLVFATFFIVIIKAGSTFTHHAYYMIPFVPVMALTGGYGIAQINIKWLAVVLLLAVAAEGIANQQHDFRIKKKDKTLVNIEQDMDKISGKNDLVVINSGAYPTPMYFAHRKGWIAFNAQISDSTFITGLQQQGARYIIILKKTFGSELLLPYKKLVSNDYYDIYGL